MLSYAARLTALLILLVVGCDAPDKRQTPPPAPPFIGRGTPAAPRPLAVPDKPISPARQTTDIDDRASLIPPPPKRLDTTTPPASVPPVADPNIQLIGASKDDAALAKGPSGADSLQSGGAMTPRQIDGDEALTVMKRIHQNSVSAYAKMDRFEARLTRRETLNGKATPQEVISYKFRKQPFSVRLKWIGQEGQGREVVYVLGQYGGKMHVMPSKQDSFLLPPTRMAFLPDDSMVRSKTRHDIREAGFGESIRQLGDMLDLIAKNPAQRPRLRYLGLVTRNEFPNKMEAIEETVPAKTEQLFPQGGKRFYFFDTGPQSPSFGLPVIVVAYDAGTKKEVEYYCFDNFLYPIRLNDADFDPEQVWKRK